MEAARENNETMPSISPYSNRVIQIKTGKPIFNEPEPANDINDSSTSFFDAIGLKQEPSGDGCASSSGKHKILTK